MISKISELRKVFANLSSIEQKEQFIINLATKNEYAENKKYKNFLYECIELYYRDAVKVFENLATIEQKEQFIVKLAKKMEDIQNEEYNRFLHECIRRYVSEAFIVFRNLSSIKHKKQFIIDLEAKFKGVKSDEHKIFLYEFIDSYNQEAIKANNERQAMTKAELVAEALVKGLLAVTDVRIVEMLDYYEALVEKDKYDEFIYWFEYGGGKTKKILIDYIKMQCGMVLPLMNLFTETLDGWYNAGKKMNKVPTLHNRTRKIGEHYYSLLTLTEQ